MLQASKSILVYTKGNIVTNIDNLELPNFSTKEHGLYFSFSKGFCKCFSFYKVFVARSNDFQLLLLLF